MPLTFGIASLLRFLHNICCKRRRQRDAALYRASCEAEDLRAIVENMARIRKRALKMDDIQIPSLAIKHMIQNSTSDMTLEEGCRRYLNAYLDEEKTT